MGVFYNPRKANAAKKQHFFAKKTLQIRAEKQHLVSDDFPLFPMWVKEKN